ncbi:MAG: hypothetical protein MJZ52_07285 [Bacteroidales bacterium]|nr:hypothetical protein [Bacteroidales bacterium]
MNRLLYLLGKNNFINDVPVACVPATGTKNVYHITLFVNGLRKLDYT